ncbi:hypothetical protein [Nonomuraea sp. SBT364]|uniref:hypothetical protein n=1 Tax=Nonomuraea sp. SBT364 TaxID=1580530 RepID=UPI00066CB409|nr:hypothetical protein [Nonomuraea sp. SBT364]
MSDTDFSIPDLAVVPREIARAGQPELSPEHVRLAVAYGAAGIPVHWRVELDEGPTVHAYAFDGDSCGRADLIA